MLHKRPNFLNNVRVVRVRQGERLSRCSPMFVPGLNRYHLSGLLLWRSGVSLLQPKHLFQLNILTCYFVPPNSTRLTRDGRSS